MKFQHFLLSVLAASSVAPAFSQAKELTLDDAISMAYMNNPSVQASQSGVDAAIHRKKAAWGLGVPKLSVGANYTYMSQNIGEVNFNGQKDAVVNFLGQLPLPLPPSVINGLKSLDLSYILQKRDFAAVNASLVVPVFTGGKINAANRIAKLGVTSAQNTLDETNAELFTEITERYWGLALAIQIQDLRQGVIGSMEQHARNAYELEQNGLIAKGERLFADMALSQSKAAFVEAQGNTRTINTALCGSVATEGDFKPVTELFVNNNLPTLQYFKEQTSLNSHILEKVELLRRMSVELVKIERADFYPTIGAMGNATLWNYNLTDQLPRWVVGAGIQWTLFNGLTREHSYAAAKSDARKVTALQAKAKLDIQTLVEKLYYTLQGAAAQVEASENTIAFATEYLRMKNEAFAEGMATSNQVVEAQLNLTKAQLERMAAAYAFDTTLAKLLAVAGISFDYAKYQNDPSNKFIK